MSIPPLQPARVSTLMRTQSASSAIARTQAQLLKVQDQLTTGRRINAPSDDPGAAAIAQQLRKTLEQREAYSANIRHAVSQLGETDATLGDLAGLLQEAQTIASANIGSDVTAEQRQSALQIIQSIYNQAFTLANRQFGGLYLFGGDSAGPPFVEMSAGVRFAGSSSLPANRNDQNSLMPFMVDGQRVFDALSGRVSGSGDLGEQITPLTPLGDLRGGAGIDPAGLTISNGHLSAAIDLAGAATVEDLLNRINGADLGVLARINAAGTGIDIVNATQGPAMSIGENGGDTAQQLGVRTLGPQTRLADFNHGRGVGAVEGDDLLITRSDGTSFSVNLSAAGTVQDVLDAINTSAGSAMATLAATGNGIILTDDSGGGGTFAISAVNHSSAVADLGLNQPPDGDTIRGMDAATVRTDGIFAHLARLRDALESNDQPGITAASEGLAGHHARLVLIRGQTGAQIQELESRQWRLEDQNLATRSLLATLEETDFVDAIARFQALETALAASLQTAGRSLNLSLMDFLR